MSTPGRNYVPGVLFSITANFWTVTAGVFCLDNC
jgi:hypothetical protein